MGAKGSTVKTKLTSKDIKHLKTKTGMSEKEIKHIFQQFMTNNIDGKLDRNEFKRLYDQLRAEPYQNLDAITELAFKEFDKDKSDSISFDEFLVILKFLGFFEKKINFILYLVCLYNDQ